MENINALLAAGKHHEATALIRQRLAANGSFDGAHVRCAHALVLDNDWNDVTRLLPPGTNMLDTSGWLRSLQSGRPVDRAGAPIPWMNYAAIDFIGAKISASMRVFEWGAGFSSLWFATRVKEVVSVEENATWYRELQPQLPSNVNLMCLPAQGDYVRAIRATTGEFDVIVIDGVHRNECALESISRLSSNGMIVFDNSDGADYDPSMAMFNEAGFMRIDFWGLIPSYLYKNCTSILFRNPDLLRQGLVPSRQELSTGISCMQAVDRAGTSR